MNDALRLAAKADWLRKLQDAAGMDARKRAPVDSLRVEVGCLRAELQRQKDKGQKPGAMILDPARNVEKLR